MGIRKSRTSTTGFSLIELVIVVVIIGIIAAIAIPRISRGSEGAGDAALRGDLAVLRNAVDLFATEHGGQFPSISPGDDQLFIDQLTRFSDNSVPPVTSPTKTGGFIYGPYVRKIPKLPVGTIDKPAALGTTSIRLKALKGRNNSPPFLFRPVRANHVDWLPYPGRCPGLLYRCPFGAGNFTWLKCYGNSNHH